MKLYYSPGACSLSPHIALLEAGVPFTLVKADLRKHKLDDGSSFFDVNPKGQVPVLELDDGTRLTEGPAIVQYIADQVPDRKLAPKAGTLERARLHEWLNFITAELHKGFSPLFRPETPDDYKPVIRNRLVERFGHVDRALEGRSFLLGDEFSVADGYLYTVANWAPGVGVEIGSLSNLQALLKRVGERPTVQAARKAEGAPG